MRPARALPAEPVDGEPEELLEAIQSAALLGCRGVGSSSSSLAQDDRPLLQTPDALTEAGRRAWTRKRVREQAEIHGRQP
ncbi:hypothetical protein AB0F07_16100 [Streptomyces fructofermentans]|uniref:hypothetical protein n=1 Tax=Streptomyces fructofermentans TaxID=152141 RepID=UPI0033F62254